MRYRHLFFLYAIVLVFCLTQVIRGEEDHGKSGTTASGTPNVGSRPAAPETVPADIVAFLQKWVNPSESYIKSQFKISPTLNMGLVAALEKAIQTKDEEPIEKIIAEFLGQLGEDQLKALQVALPPPAMECGKDQDASNVSRLQALKDRMALAARRAKQLVTDPPQPTCDVPLKNRILAAFDKAWPETVRYNDEIHALKAKALAGDAKALEELKTRVDANALPGFLAQQSGREGNAGDTLVADLGKLLLEKQNEKYFMNLNHLTGGQGVRADLGSDPQKFAAGLRELNADPNLRLGKFGLSPTAVPGARFVHPRATGGPGIAVTTPPTGPTATATPTPVPSGPTPTPTPTPSTGTPPGADASAVEKAALLALGGNDGKGGKCGSCHGPGGSRFTKTGNDKFRMTATGLPADATGKEIPRGSAAYREWVQAISDRALKDGDMPPDGRPQLEVAEKQSIRAWVISQGATAPAAP